MFQACRTKIDASMLQRGFEWLYWKTDISVISIVLKVACTVILVYWGNIIFSWVFRWNWRLEGYSYSFFLFMKEGKLGIDLWIHQGRINKNIFSDTKYKWTRYFKYNSYLMTILTVYSFIISILKCFYVGKKEEKL